MINLIKSELTKIFHKKGFYIVTIIFILYSLMVNCLYKSLAHEENDKSIEYLIAIDMDEITKENSLLDLNNEEDLIQYSYNVSLSELDELRSKFPSNNQKYLLDIYVYDLLCEKNDALYITKDETKYQEIENKIKALLDIIKNDDWQYFTNNKIAELNNGLANETDKLASERYEIRIKLNEYRLKNNISYDYENYLNIALIFLDTNLFEYKNLTNISELKNSELERYNYLKEEMAKNEYILKNKMDINNEFNLNSLLKDFTNEFGLFILIYLILLSGSIVSEEFNKGTIKYLLTKPYKRSTILTSKYLTILLLLPCIIIGMFLINLIIGGIIQGFGSLRMPVVLYDTAKNLLVTENIFLYNIKLVLSVLPMYLILGTFCFSLSAITASTSSAVTLTFALYLIGNVISSLYLTYKIKIFELFASLHWDFSYLVNISSNPFNIKPLTSILIVVFYISVMLCLTYVYFNKKDVKNI